MIFIGDPNSDTPDVKYLDHCHVIYTIGVSLILMMDDNGQCVESDMAGNKGILHYKQFSLEFHYWHLRSPMHRSD